MEIVVKRLNAIRNIEETFVENVTDTSMSILSISHCEGIVTTYKKYYPYDTGEMLADSRFPYLFRSGKILWNVPFSDATIQDMVDTFPDILTEGLFVESGMPAAGGLGYLIGRIAFDAAIELCGILFPNQIVSITVFGILGNALIMIRDYYDEKNVETSPIQMISASLQYSRIYKSVGKIEMCELLGLDEYHMNSFLTSIGFLWNSETEKYYLPDAQSEKVMSLLARMQDNEMNKLEKGCY